MKRAIVLALALAPGIARAQPAPPEPEPAPPAPEPAPPPAEPAPPPTNAKPAEAPPTNEELANWLDELEEKQKKLAEKQAYLEGTREQVKALVPLRHYITMWIDVGAFAVGGDGSGIRSDIGHVYYPQYAGGRIAGQWVIMGDTLSTAINSNGDPADTSDSREVTNDSLHTRGHPSLLVNSVGLDIRRSLDHDISVASLVELLPRPGPDILDVELAHIDYRPDGTNLEVSVGKVDSVLGIEYRSQDAPDRIGIAPSLIWRYTSGRPFGGTVRWVHGPLSASAAIIDGNFFAERFEPSTALKANAWPTGAGHLQWTFPVGEGLELGISGAVGPQDKQPDSSVVQWHVGLDARLRTFHGFDLTAEYVQGIQQGQTTSPSAPCNAAPCLDYKGAYLLLDHRMNHGVIPYVRVDWRDAVHQNGANFIYESHNLRATFGLHVELTHRIVGKIEYTFNRELDAIPDFPDDILTSSVVVMTD